MDAIAAMVALAASPERHDAEFVEQLCSLWGSPILCTAPQYMQKDKRLKKLAEKIPVPEVWKLAGQVARRSTRCDMADGLAFLDMQMREDFALNLLLVRQSYSFFHWLPEALKADRSFQLTAATMDGHVAELGVDMTDLKISLAACASWNPALKSTPFSDDPIFICALLREGAFHPILHVLLYLFLLLCLFKINCMQQQIPNNFVCSIT